MPNFLTSLLSDRTKKSLKWSLIPIAILLAVLAIRSCSNHVREHHRPYKIGRDTSWYPVQLFGKEKYLVAFTNDIIANIALAGDIRFQWVDANPRTLVDGLDIKQYDLILTTLRPTVINQEQYRFSEMVFEFGPVLVVREDSKASSLEDIRGQTVGIPSGVSTAFNAVRIAGAHNFDLFVVTYSNIHQALNDLANNLIDGVIIEALPAYNFTQGLYSGRLKVVSAPLTDEGLRFVALKNADSSSIIDIINTNLEKMHHDGTYDALIKKWDLVDPETSFTLPKEAKKS